ncbi:MAG: formylglycine-generating enzyme family protein [Planctomycetaceae bacterium]
MKESLPPAVTLRLPGELDLEFRCIPAGKFRMGARGESPHEEPVHRVRLTQPFYLGQFPVTQAQYAAFRPDHQNEFPGDSRRPVENVSWEDAMAYCAWLNDRSNVVWPSGLDGFTARLPSEAQWEYACRGGTETEYHTGDGAIALGAAGWYDENSDQKTQPVGLKAPNANGLYDMHGNVDEWCADAWLADAYKLRVDGVCDPEVTEQDVEGDVLRVVRGGSWNYRARDCRAAYRGRIRPVDRDWGLGFRVCLFPGPCRAESRQGQERARGPGDGARRQAVAQSEGPVAAASLRPALPSTPSAEPRNKKGCDP